MLGLVKALQERPKNWPLWDYLRAYWKGDLRHCNECRSGPWHRSWWDEHDGSYPSGSPRQGRRFKNFYCPDCTGAD